MFWVANLLNALNQQIYANQRFRKLHVSGMKLLHFQQFSPGRGGRAADSVQFLQGSGTAIVEQLSPIVHRISVKMVTEWEESGGIEPLIERRAIEIIALQWAALQ